MMHSKTGKYLLILFVFLLIKTYVNAQPQQDLKDKLRAGWNTYHDTTRLKMLNEIFGMEDDPDSAKKFNHQIKTIAEKNIAAVSPGSELHRAYTIFLGDYYLNAGLILIDEGQKEGGMQAQRTALRYFTSVNYKSGIANSLNDIAMIFERSGGQDSAEIYYEKALGAAREGKCREDEAMVLDNLGIHYRNEGDNDKAEKAFLESMKLQKETNDKTGLLHTLNNLAVLYEAKGDIMHAIDYYNESLKLAENLGEKKLTADLLNNLAMTFYYQNDLESAETYNLKSLSIRKKISDKSGIAISMTNLGKIKQDKNEFDSAMVYYEKALRLREETGNIKWIANSYSNIGLLLDRTERQTEALKYHKKALKLRQDVKERKGIASSLNNIGSILIRTGKTAEGIKSCEQSLQEAQSLGYPEQIGYAAASLKLGYQIAGNFKRSLEMYELHIRMRDSISNAETRKASTKQQLKYEYEKKAAADSVKAAEDKKVVAAQLKQEQTQRYALYGGLGLVGIFAIFMVNRFRVTNKQKKLIEKQKKLVEQQKEVVEEKQKEILDSIHYARRIQKALITSEFYIGRQLTKLRKQ